MISPEWQKMVTECKEGVRLQVKLSPGASKTKVLGPHGDCLKIAVNAPPEKGKANHALVEFLAELLNIPKQNISIHSGLTSPRKTLLIKGVTKDGIITVFVV